MYLLNHHAHLTGKQAEKMLEQIRSDEICMPEIKACLHLIRLEKLNITIAVMNGGAHDGRTWEIEGIILLDWERERDRKRGKKKKKA